MAIENEHGMAFLKRTTPFTHLSDNLLKDVCRHLVPRTYHRGGILFHQGTSTIENVIIIEKGTLELFYDIAGRKILSSFHGSGDICGGIAILKNKGAAIRTIMATSDVSCFLLSGDRFLHLCRQSSRFKDYFERIYKKLIRDESYVSIISASQAFQFISAIPPFTFLPPEVVETLAPRLSMVQYPRDTIIFSQGGSTVDCLYILQKGAVERYFEDKNTKTLRGVLSEGAIYGGISMLLNDGISVRTLKTNEHSFFYVLPRQEFLELCGRYEVFSEFFTDTFGKRMLDRSYSEIITKKVQPRDETLRFFNQPVLNFYHSNLLACGESTSIRKAAAEMSNRRCSSIFVKNDTGEHIGVVTDNDFRVKVVARGLDVTKPVADIMSTPLVSVSIKEHVFEALITMMRDNIKHLAVRDSSDRVVGVVTNQDLLTAQGQSPIFVIRDIENAIDFKDIENIHSGLPPLVQGFINSGTKSRNVNRLITTISDAVLKKIIWLSIEEMGAPPVDFVFMIMGSEGRREQTLKTDQDNAIVYEDVGKGSEKTVHTYFMQLGEKVCTQLDKAGYDFCKGGIMAKNEKWCQPLSQWIEYFNSWIHVAEAEELLKASIFFDFRAAYGNQALIDRLRKSLFDSLTGWAGFFRHLTENALQFKPPLGFFRNFVVESRGRHRNAFDIKSAMQPIVDLARIYALKNRITATNTQERLELLYQEKILSWSEYNELDQAYSFLMQQRFLRQISAIIEERVAPDNYVNPKKLSNIEQTLLKEIFRRIEKYQSRLEFEFTGLA